MRKDALLALLRCASVFLFASVASAQSVAPARQSPSGHPPAKMEGNLFGLDEMRRQIGEQREELERMRVLISEQARALEELRARVERAERTTPEASAPAGVRYASFAAERGTSAVAASPPSAQAVPRKEESDVRLTRVEEQARKTSEALSRQLGSITFSGDVRFRYELQRGLLDSSPNAADPSILGNELTARNRLRVRARLAVRGKMGDEFEWGLRLATGSYAEPVSGNQTLTDFYTRKPFGLDQAFVVYKPKALRGLQVQGGKFEAPWMRTEMIFDSDLQHEGLAESFTHDFKTSLLKNLTLVAWQMPFLERNSAFVRNPDGTVNVAESGRQGRDLALYGGQVRARLQPADDAALTVAASNFYFSGTQFVSPAQLFGGQVQLPVTVLLPATADAPARTVAGVATVPRSMLVAGGNLGLMVGSSNAVGRDGRLASGYNLVNLIGRLDLMHHRRFPVSVTLDYVTNTQARPVSVAGPGGSTVFLENDEDDGFWAELQVGKTRERGDLLFGYTFARIEKDAVLSPFNYNELVQSTDVRAHRLTFSYAADPRVVLTVTCLFSQRAHGFLGPFGNTPHGSLNGPTTRLQFDTLFRF